MASSPPLHLAIIGYTGGVSTSFLQQLSSLDPSVSLPPSIPKPVIVFASRSSQQLYNTDYSPLGLVSPGTLQGHANSKTLNFEELAEWLSKSPGPACVADNTANQSVADAYPLFLQKGVSVITPNKKAFSSSLELWDKMMAATRAPSGGLLYHESSVGAGMPIISTLTDLVKTGDRIVKVDGVFSGTMSFLFNTFERPDAGKWSAIVAQAKANGYTEPDPREDLNGMDVARKCVILARLCGLRVESLQSFPVQSLIPEPLRAVQSVEDFMARLPEHDADMEQYKTEAEKQGKVVRFVGSVDVPRRTVRVGLEMVQKGSPLGGLKGSDNLICFYTQRYGANPLVLQGSGAGNDVTAMGVLADLLKVVERTRGSA